ncbi:S-adenosyl-L-methionine-dependent methyltransferase [Diplogelasinospora grovesii]|uniref:S-adenosyl-L-methionine-dependent methyltransferase n=1 Tax=Diplogelasinospora grovesii TaxID=303347 RepID=A0AAN6N6E1_9PEZI|nr:S-adenosyl-L-methionine-dependent methyltransferase [Diplogelasinospora grovesii]
MATFARSTFSSAGYAAFRPSYPSSLFNRVLAFHNAKHGSSGTLVDLGCGHGLVARALAPHFSSIIALDPSQGMVEQAKKLTTDQKITIRQGSAEDLSFLSDQSVDCVVAGQAAHWFDYSKVWPELARVVKRGSGTLAFWGYKDHAIVGHPELTPIFDKFIYDEPEPVPGTESMARFWELPGRNILRDSLQEVVPPETDWAEVTRIAWDPDRNSHDMGVNSAPEAALWQRKTLKLGELEGYVRTFSSFAGWQIAHPDRKSRAQGAKEGDVVDLLFDEIVATVPEWKAKGEKWGDIEVDTVWGTVLLMAQRR